MCLSEMEHVLSKLRKILIILDILEIMVNIIPRKIYPPLKLNVVK
jgi:hypothetical protein